MQFINHIKQLLFPYILLEHTVLTNQAAHIQKLPGALQQAAITRKDEFLTGRCLAAKILQQQGIEDTQNVFHYPLPEWPTGWLGSISHCATDVIVALTQQADYLGIDLEYWVDAEFAMQSADLLLHAHEKQLYANLASQLSWTEYLTLVFSIKESLYKAIYPKVQQYIDFLEAYIVDLDLATQTLSLSFTADIQHQHQLQREYYGYWYADTDFIATMVSDLINKMPLQPEDSAMSSA